jgi:hypothetical protein
LAVAGLWLAACSSGTPTAPSPLTARDAGVSSGTASQVSASPSGIADAAAGGARPIEVTRGTLAFEARRPGSIVLKGSRGFAFEGRVISGLEPSENCGAFNPCQPGAAVPFTASWVGTDIPGTVRLQGKEFPVGSLDTGSVFLELLGSFVAPPRLTDSASVTAPFTVGGLLSLGYPYEPIELAGRGHVTFTLQWQPAIDGWAITFAAFDFGGGRRH